MGFVEVIVGAGMVTLAGASLHSLLNKEGGPLEFLLFCTSSVVFFKVLF